MSADPRALAEAIIDRCGEAELSGLEFHGELDQLDPTLTPEDRVRVYECLANAREQTAARA